MTLPSYHKAGKSPSLVQAPGASLSVPNSPHLKNVVMSVAAFTPVLHFS